MGCCFSEDELQAFKRQDAQDMRVAMYLANRREKERNDRIVKGIGIVGLVIATATYLIAVFM